MKSSRQTKASFAVVGASRSGTSSLLHYLSQHPLIQVCPSDKTGYFASDHFVRSDSPESKSYDQLYDSVATHIIKGEVFPDYLHNHQSIARLFQYNRDLKLISILRNPAERAFSHWQMAVNQRLEDRPFSKAIEFEMLQVKSGKNYSDLETSYISRGMYGIHIQNLHKYFDPHQLLFMRSDDFMFDTEVMMYQVFQFLNIPYEEVDCVAQNIGNYHSSIPVEDYNSTIGIFEKDIYLTEELLGWNCNDWIRPASTKKPITSYFQERIHQKIA